MNFVGRIAFAFLMLCSACGPRYEKITSEQFSELLSQCQDMGSPLSDPVLARLLGNKEVSDDPQFDASAAREFTENVTAKWYQSLDDAEVCLGRLSPEDRTCEAFRACQLAFADREL